MEILAEAQYCPALSHSRMELVHHWITQYGYVAIFSLLVLGIVGLPVPDETLLTFAGYLVYQGRLQILPTFLAALLGSMCGISVSYLLGYTAGYHLIKKYGRWIHITPDRLNYAHEWFERLGKFALTFGYYIPGVRHLTAYVAGASKLEFPVFAAFGYGGAVLWTTTFIVLGYVLGERWERIAGEVHHAVLVAGSVIGGLAIVYLLWKRYRPRRP